MISLIQTSTYLPEKIVTNDFFLTEGCSEDHPMFKGTELRHHVSEFETPAFMIEQASNKIIENLNLNVKKDVDIILTNVTCLDQPFTGIGAETVYRLGAAPQWIIDHHNGGCISFIQMMDVARALMAGSDAKTALICNVQNGAGRIFSHKDNLSLAQAAVPGDGCGVGYLVKNNSSPVLSIAKKTYGQYAKDMVMTNDNNDNWWDPREQQMHVEFTTNKIAKIIGRANKMVPEIMYDALEYAHLKASDIDLLVTNQPNLNFLRNWRESLMLNEDQHIHTFKQHGNLFGAGLPISITKAVDEKRLNKGDFLMLGGFAHAGDYAAASVIHWHANMQG